MSLPQLGGLLLQSEPYDGHSPRYMPILKARQGELRALEQLEARGEPVGLDLTPIVELVEVDFNGLSIVETEAQIEKLASKVSKAWGRGRPRIAIDASGVEVDLEPLWTGHEDIVDPTAVTPLLLRRLWADGIRAVPVVRLSDQEELKRDLAHVLAAAPEVGACLRIGGEDLDDQVVPLDQAVEKLLEELQLAPQQVDLVLDFGALNDDAATAMASRLARFVLPTLDRDPWRSFVLGAGAFPVNLGEVPAFAIAELPRRDRQLWIQVNALRLRRTLGYADYAVTHPLLQTGVAFAAPPQIRYTAEKHWLVAKGRRTDRRGHRQFFDLCERLRSTRPSEIAPRELGWGDVEFHEAADKANTEGDKPGNASTWRAIATSHHINYVLNGLRTRGEP